MNRLAIQSRAAEGLVEAQDSKALSITEEQLDLATARCKALEAVLSQAREIKRVKEAHILRIQAAELELGRLQDHANSIGAYELADSIALAARPVSVRS